MHVGIDYTAAVWQGAGIGRYTRELVRALLDADKTIRYSLFYAAGGIDPNSEYVADLHRLRDRYAHVRAIPISFSPRRLTQLWQRLRVPLPIETFTGALDLVHVPDFVPPPARARTLVTIHDLSYLVHPECAQPGLARYLGAAVPRGLRKASVVFADSKATQHDLERLLGVEPSRVQVVYPGVAPRFRPLSEAETEPVRQRLGLAERFILFVSTLEPRKNLVRLLEAFASLTCEQSVQPVQLVIGGKRGWMYEPIFDAIDRLDLSERVQLLDYVDDKDLPALYNLADVFAYPSIYEGFGLPALEALACGTPVVTADNSSLPEVVGNAAILVPADDVAAIADGLTRALNDTQLREHLRRIGPEQASRFTWSGVAAQVVATYRSLYSDG